MDLSIFEEMEKKDLCSYIEFLLWHYRVIDAFWYINITENFDEPTADRLNEKVSLKHLNISPGALLSAMKLRKPPMKFLFMSPRARRRQPELEGD